jgi:hypothetical protein
MHDAKPLSCQEQFSFNFGDRASRVELADDRRGSGSVRSAKSVAGPITPVVKEIFVLTGRIKGREFRK